MKLLCSAAFTSSLLPLGFADAWHHVNASCSLEPNKSYPLTTHAHLNAYIASSPESTELFPGLPCFVLELGICIATDCQPSPYSTIHFSHFHFIHLFPSFNSLTQQQYKFVYMVVKHYVESQQEVMNVCRFCCVSSKPCWTTHDTVLWQSHHSYFDL